MSKTLQTVERRRDRIYADKIPAAKELNYAKTREESSFGLDGTPKTLGNNVEQRRDDGGRKEGGK